MQTVSSTPVAASAQRTRKARKRAALPFSEIFMAYVHYMLMILFAYVAEWSYQFASLFDRKRQSTPKGYAPLLKDFEYLFTRYMYTPVRDCWDRMIRSAPSAYVDVAERYSNDRNKTFVYTNRVHHALNLGSYNYLGFSETDTKCNAAVIDRVREFGTSTTSAQSDAGSTTLHRLVEERTARYTGKEAAIVFPMGYATNATVLPNLIGKGGLIISDANNHASAIMGCRASGAKITIFKHNAYLPLYPTQYLDPSHLERVLRKAISEGQPRTHRPWTKILIVVEGIYSMEGEILALQEIVAIKRKYKAYLYVDEAHSIGAIGPHGKGVCDYAGVDPADVDILMGTFTKSFASVGGYIAGNKDLIEYLRNSAFSALYDTSHSVPCCQQIISAFDVIEGVDGTGDGQRRLKQIRDNSIYFRQRLNEMGFVVLGNEDSPVIPVLLGAPGKVHIFSRECLSRGLAVVVVGFPATPLIETRVRFCMSAGHTRADLDIALTIIRDVGDLVMMRYLKDKPMRVAHGDGV